MKEFRKKTEDLCVVDLSKECGRGQFLGNFSAFIGNMCGQDIERGNEKSSRSQRTHLFDPPVIEFNHVPLCTPRHTDPLKDLKDVVAWRRSSVLFDDIGR